MEIIKTNAIALRSIKHSESSRIIKFFTEERGKVSLLAKGARKAKNRVPMDTFSLMNVVYRHKPSRDIQLLTQAELMNAFLGIRDNMGRSAIAFGICELVERTTEVDDPNPELFRLMASTLAALDGASSNPRNYYWYFQLGLIKVLGFGFNPESCVICGKGIRDFKPISLKFSFQYGGIICPDCGVDESKAAPLKPEAMKVLQFLYSHKLEKLGRLKPSKAATQAIDALFWGFLKYHIDGLEILKSRELISKI